MQQLIQELRSPRLRTDDSTEVPSAVCLRAARAIETLYGQAKADLLKRQQLEQNEVKFTDIDSAQLRLFP